jgi:cell division protein FtsL
MLYLLAPLTVGLILIEDNAEMSDTWHLIFLAVIAVVICAAALLWIEHHPRLVETDGVHYQARTRYMNIEVHNSAQFEPIRHNGTTDEESPA